MWHPAGWILVAVVFPLWVASGFADWACHRASGIERTSGLTENVLHWAMFGQMGVAVLAMALLEVTAGVLLLVAVLFVLHEATVWLDLRWTVPVRSVTPSEQMVHSFQELLPLTSLLLLAVMGWEQALALAGLGSAAPDYALRWKAQPLPPLLLAGGAAAVALLNVAPLAQETAACVRAGRRR